MDADVLLDLKGVPSPISLLKCKGCLEGMARGEVLGILMQDTDLAEDLKLIVRRSDDILINLEKAGDCLRLTIRKG